MRHISLLAVAGFFTWQLPSIGMAATPHSSTVAAPKIKQVLLREANPETSIVDRRELLHPTTHPKTASDAEWWQSGFVKAGGGWRHASEVSPDGESTLLAEYRSLRDRTPKAADTLMRLANWCHEKKLLDQERSHLSQLLMMQTPSTERAAIFRRLGYRQVGQQWLSPAERDTWEASVKRTDEQLRQWQPAAQRIVRNWGGSPKQQKLAREELTAINQASAIPALVAISAANEALGLQVCDQLNSMPIYEASRGLAVMAVRSNSPSVRQAATAVLKRSRIDDFAPALLSEMRSPFEATGLNNGTAAPRLILREEADRYVAIDVEFIPGFVQIASVYRAPNLGLSQLYAASAQYRTEIDGGRFVDDVDEQIRQQMDVENDQADEINRRAAEVLSAVSGQKFSTDPRYWWTWWHLHTGTQEQPKGLQAQVVKEQLPSAIGVDAIVPVPAPDNPQPGGRRHGACLIAGSMVLTETGMVAIEQIQVGDRVLSKDVITGEVTYKSVLLTTVRKPVPVKTFIVAETKVTASDAHHFWSSGTGWAKTRELKVETPIHTATGMARIQSIQTEPDPAPVYNLIVADFHTYFVGSAMILSHDVLLPSPTNVKVPGLDVEVASKSF